MSENMTGGLVEELRALLAEGEHADTCGSVLSPEAGYPCSCWKADLTVLLDVHASRTANDPRPCKGSNVNICVAEGCYDKACTRAMGDNVAVSSSPEPGAVEALARLLYRQLHPGSVNTPDSKRTRESDFAEAERAYEIWDSGKAGWAHERECRGLAQAVLAGLEAAGYLSPADVERVVAAAKAEAWDECVRALAWCLDNGYPENAPGYLVKHNPYRAAGPERRTEPDEAKKPPCPWSDDHGISLPEEA